MNKKVVIWGLNKKRHSHRYIHQGFYNNFKQLGYQVVWVEDEKRNQKYLEGSNLVISVNIASRHILNLPNNSYVLHNFQDPAFSAAENVLNLQVWTKNSVGSQIDGSIALYDQDSKTLFQPWGVPELESNWLNPIRSPRLVEYWIGAIWNNALNQGNLHEINEYRQILNILKIDFMRVGGTRWLTKNGVSPTRAYELANRSPLGSAVVGAWQEDKGYVPCRLFKNVAAGCIPSSNANFTAIFGDSGIFDSNINSLVTKVLGVRTQEKLERVADAQSKLENYTYKSAINRILTVMDLSRI